MLARILIVTLFATINSVVAANAQQVEHKDHTKTESVNSKDDGQKSPKVGSHGGSLQSLGTYQVETLIRHNGLRLFVYDSQGRPVDLRQARGIASLKVRDDSKRYRYELFADVERDNSAKSLVAAVDLSRIAGRQVELEFHLSGLPRDKQRHSFREVATVPMTSEQLVAAAIAAQKICPVSGEPLGSMGEPIAVELEQDRTIYVCCKGCIDAVKKEPTKFLAAKQPLELTTATKSDADAVALQKVCPVMDEPLGSMGEPLKVTGLGRDVFLCCKGCLKFLKKDPQKYLAKLPPLPKAKSKVVKATKDDRKLAAQQKTCPVMDEPLDAMGGPWKTVVAGRTIFLCCPGCAKKLHANPQFYFKKLESAATN